MDEALNTVLQQDAIREAAHADRSFPARPGPHGVPPLPGITSEMIRERETAHLRGQERLDAMANVQSPAQVPHITKEMAVAACQAYGYTVLHAEAGQGGIIAEMESRIAKVIEQNGKLVDRVNRAEKEARDSGTALQSALAEVESLKNKTAPPPAGA